jgi:hypothetical protein
VGTYFSRTTSSSLFSALYTNPPTPTYTRE